MASAKRGAQNLLETQLLRRYELLRVSSHVGDFPLSFHLMKTLFVLISIVAKQRYYLNILCQKMPKLTEKRKNTLIIFLYEEVTLFCDIKQTVTTVLLLPPLLAAERTLT